MRTRPVYFTYLPDLGIRLWLRQGSSSSHLLDSLAPDLDRKLQKVLGNKPTSFKFYGNNIIEDIKGQPIGLSAGERSFLKESIEWHEFSRGPNCHYANDIEDDEDEGIA